MLTVTPAKIQYHTTGNKMYLGRFDSSRHEFTFLPVITHQTSDAKPDSANIPIPLPENWQVHLPRLLSQKLGQFIIQPQDVAPILSGIISALRQANQSAKAKINFPSQCYFVPHDDVVRVQGLLDMAYREGTTIHREPLKS